jgi:hypothetical protein
MQALDSFISPIPGFEGDILIPAIPILARPPGSESINDPSARANASISKSWAGKRKETANPTPQKKAKKVVGKSSGEIKINEPIMKAPALTPPLGPRQMIPNHISKRYAYRKHYLFLPSK